MELNCRVTKSPFHISEAEIEAYRHFDLPLPDLCAEERVRRRLAFRSAGKFFWRTCHVTDERILSSYSENVPFPVVSVRKDEEPWFDAHAYGRDYDGRVSFFRQLFELWKVVPRRARNVWCCDQSPTIQECSKVTDSVLITHGRNVRGSAYCFETVNSDECFDCLAVSNSRDCFECINCFDCDELSWGEHCEGCSSSSFLFNCRDCKDCLFCGNLEGKRYHIYNKPVSPEKYQQELLKLKLDTRAGLHDAREKFYNYIREMSVPHAYTTDDESVLGNYLRDCNDVFACYQCESAGKVVYCDFLHDAFQCLDGSGFGLGLKNSAQFVSVGGRAKNIVNCVECHTDIENLTYCFNCISSKNCFGCVGLQGAEFCILNKQYSESDFNSALKAIREQMLTRREWGAFFPFVFSPYAYNHSAAGQYMQINEVQAGVLEVIWDSENEHIRPSQLLADASGGADRFSDIPDRLENVDSKEALSGVYICELSGRPFQLAEMELEFYRRRKLALPVRAFEQRHRERLARLSPPVLLSRKLTGEEELRTMFPGRWRQKVVPRSTWIEEVRANSSD